MNNSSRVPFASMFSSSSTTSNSRGNNNKINTSSMMMMNNIAKATNSAIARKATTTLTPDQLACIERLQDCFDRVLECKRRDMHLGTLQQSIATFTDDADKEEPLTARSF